MSMIATAAPGLEWGPRDRAAADDLTVEVATSFAAAETVWRSLETDAVMSPYGRFDWVRVFAHEAGDVRIAIVRDTRGEPALLIPIAVERRLGLSIGGAVGGRHVNYALPLVRRDLFAHLDAEAASRLLRRIGAALRVDTLALGNVPVLWEGSANPFAAEGRPGADDAWALPLDPDGDATLARSMSTDARKKLRNKARGLAKLGTVAILQASTEHEVDLILDAFLTQKEERFRDLGIADPFAGATMRAALRQGATARLMEGRPGIELYGLTVDGRVVAVLGAAGDARRLSGMFLSFEAGGEAARFSPGEILVTEVIRRQCASGRTTFDLGVGDARYKRSICDTREALVDVVVPVTARGRLYGACLAAATAAKRRIKADPRAMALVGRIRKATRRG